MGDIRQELALQIVHLLHLVIGILQGLEHAIDRVGQARDLIWWPLRLKAERVIADGSNFRGCGGQAFQGASCSTHEQPDQQSRDSYVHDHSRYEEPDQQSQGKGADFC